jgi:hypothetical protein
MNRHMGKSKVARKPAKIPAVAPTDRGESPALMEPMILSAASTARPELTDLVLELASRSTGFTRSLSKGFATALADLVRSMNCYYSNLIEGHDTHPVDIEKAPAPSSRAYQQKPTRVEGVGIVMQSFELTLCLSGYATNQRLQARL